MQKSHFVKNYEHELAYHFVIDGNGVVFEGEPIEARGAHTELTNTGKIGIALMGNFESSDDTFRNIIQGARPTSPTEAQKESLLGLINALIKRLSQCKNDCRT